MVQQFMVMLASQFVTMMESKNTTINHVNKDRKNNTDSIYLYTEDYGTSTKSTIPGVEVVLQANGYLKVGGTVTATVKEVRTQCY